MITLSSFGPVGPIGCSLVWKIAAKTQVSWRAGLQPLSILAPWFSSTTAPNEKRKKKHIKMCMICDPDPTDAADLAPDRSLFQNPKRTILMAARVGGVKSVPVVCFVYPPPSLFLQFGHNSRMFVLWFCVIGVATDSAHPDPFRREGSAMINGR